MNLLAEVLSSAEKVEQDDINKKVPDLKLSIENLRCEVFHYIDSAYRNFIEKPRMKKSLLNKCYHMKTEVEKLKKNAEYILKKELFKVSDDLDNNIKILDTIDSTLQILTVILEINEAIIKFQNLFEDKNYLDCMELIFEMELKADGILENEFIETVDLFEIGQKTSLLIYNLRNDFSRGVSITENKLKKCTTFKIAKKLQEVEQAIQAHYLNNSLMHPIHNLIKSVWINFIVPAVDNVVKFEDKEDGENYYLNIYIIDTTTKDKYDTVFASIEVIINFMKEHFYLNLNENLTTLDYIGMNIRDDLSKLIIEHCLKDTIPSTPECLKNYQEVVTHVKNFESFLRDCHIFSENRTTLIDYTSNIDVLFVNKKCNKYLRESQQIMEKDLEQKCEVSLPYRSDKLLLSAKESMQCSVSKSVIEFLNFNKHILEEAVTTSETWARNLLYTAKINISSYRKFVPEYHSKKLEHLPVQVALFHNNCFFIAKELTYWNECFCTKLPEHLNTFNFTGEIDLVKKSAAEVFTDYINSQIELINCNMREALFQLIKLDYLQPKTEKCVRQCLHQFEVLKTAWCTVLPYPIYNKAIGVILNSLSLYIINAVVKFKTISSIAAKDLVEILNIIMTKGPKLFTDPEDVSLYVSSWLKLNELNSILEGNLIDISNRWSNGKGSIALQFHSEEVKALIQALFPNTDKKTAVLKHILG